MIADGESQVKNKFILKYGSTPIQGHTINWKFKFWTLDTLQQASQDQYGKDFYDLTVEEQESIFNTTPPDYEGTGSSEYGSLTSSSITDSSGIATSIYTSGTEPGYIEFWAQDGNIRLAERGSFFLILPWLKHEKKKEKLKLRVYSNLPSEAKSYLQSSFDFLGSDRFEWVSQQFTTCGVNEFNVLDSPTPAGFTGYEMGRYRGNSACEVYWDKIQGSYTTNIYERAGLTGAHEIGHSNSWWVNHHSNCIMISNITDLPEGYSQSFCDTCQKRFFKKLGGQ